MFFLLLAAFNVFVNGETPPEILRNPSFLHLLNKHYSSLHSPRTYWPYYGDNSSQKYRGQEDSHRYASEGLSHNYAPHPKSPVVKTVPHLTTESPFSYPSHSASQEYWSPSSRVTWRANSTKAHGYVRFYPGLSSSTGGASYPTSNQDSIEGSHSMFQYQQIRTPTRVYVTVKKPPVYYSKGQIQIKGIEGTEKPKYKKNNSASYYVPSSYKKTIYPRVHKPHAMHKYPTKKTVYPIYRRYYQSPFQQYLISSSDMPRNKVKNPSTYSESNVYHKVPEHTTETSSLIRATDRYFTTERMDENQDDRYATSKDYANYNHTYENASSNSYENYEEVENATSATDENSYDEIATRGYYGDRIYMSTQVPPKSSDKATTINKYYIVRRTSGDHDIETIFE